jgi:hypothetical protein
VPPTVAVKTAFAVKIGGFSERGYRFVTPSGLTGKRGFKCSFAGQVSDAAAESLVGGRSRPYDIYQ